MIIYMLPGPVGRILHKRSLAQMVNIDSLSVFVSICVGGRICNPRNDDE